MVEDHAQHLTSYVKLRLIFAAIVCMASLQVVAVDISNRYRSPRNHEREVRPSTDFIILHTTEGGARSALNKLSERGECHYVVTEDGSIYRIIDREREAYHAGRSMWNRREDLDKYSIGIECVGYHDKAMPLVQLYAIRDLVKELQVIYRLPDEKVVTHSQVAYGQPNRWQKKRHRGRKRCGMLFATPSVRRILGLKSRMASDPDVKAKRLVVGDAYLAKILYGTSDPMKRTYAHVKVSSPAAPTAPPKKKGFFSWFSKSSPTKPVVKVPKSVADLRAQGYKVKGKVTAGRTASSIAGGAWNKATTYYTIRDKVIPGTQINPARIEVGMSVWMK